MPDATTGPAPSLEAAGKAIEGLLSVSEDMPSTTTTPEQPPKEKEEEAEQAPAAPEESESEQAPSETPDTPETPTSPPRTFKVKVNGQEIEVTEDEVLKGYSRTEDYTRKTQQLADQRKQFEEQEVAAVRAERQQYGTYLDQLKDAIAKTTPVEPDWVSLRSQVSPDVFAAELLSWQQTQKHIAAIDGERAKVQPQQSADADRGFRSYVAEQEEKLAAVLPDFKEPEKAKALKTRLSEFALSRGFSAEDLSTVTDHRLVLLLHDAMERSDAKAKAPAIQNKIAKAMATSAPGANTTPAKTDKFAASLAKLRQTGSVEDGAASIAHLLDR